MDAIEARNASQAALTSPWCPPITATRVAVLVSVQPRTISKPLHRDDLPDVRNQSVFDSGPFAALVANGNTTADSVHAMLFDTFPAYDVFMYVQVTGGAGETAVGDLSICEPLRPRHAGARLYCAVEMQRNDIPRLPPNHQIWDHFYQAGAGVPYLQQLDGVVQVDAMRAAAERETGVSYTHWLRLRPDMAAVTPLPPLDTLQFFDPDLHVERVFITDMKQSCCGNEDKALLGLRSSLDQFVGRMDALRTSQELIDGLSLDRRWIAEQHTTMWMHMHKPVPMELTELKEFFLTTHRCNGGHKPFICMDR